MWSRGWVADPRVGGGGNVLLVLVIATYMLGVYMEGCVTPVQGVIKCLIRRVILIDTSRVSTWEKNRTTVLTVEKTFHGKLISSYTTGVSTRVRNSTTAQIVVNSFHRKFILIITYEVYIRARNHTLVLFAVKAFH